MSLNVANCNRCGKIYMKNMHGLCPACIKQLEAEYQQCLDYLRDHRQCTIQELSDGTGVSVKQIIRFIREGRISTRNNPNMTYPCDVCGTSIKENHICDSCRARLAKDASNMLEDDRRKQEQQEGKVTYLIKDHLQDRYK